MSVGAQPTPRVAWIFGKIGILPPPPQQLCDPERFQVPRKVYEKRKQEEYAAIAAKFPERVAARAALKAKHEEKKKALFEEARAAKMKRKESNKRN